MGREGLPGEADQRLPRVLLRVHLAPRRPSGSSCRLAEDARSRSPDAFEVVGHPKLGFDSRDLSAFIYVYARQLAMGSEALIVKQGQYFPT